MATKTTTRKPKASTRTSPAKLTRRAAPKQPVRSTRKTASVKPKAPTSPAKPAVPSPSGTATKQSQLIALLRSASGATVPQMTELTGWQPHTVRGTISGVLRKKLGLSVSCTAGESGSRVYRIVSPA